MKVAAQGSRISDPVVINSIWYPAMLDVIAAYGAQLDGKILVDISNPLNQTFDDLSTPPGTSAAEELARVAPAGTKVVKAFNTVFARNMSTGKVAGEPLALFVAGDDAAAKEAVMGLGRDIGFDSVDAGPLRAARYLEPMALLTIFLAIQQKMGPGIGYRLVREPT